MPDVRITPAMIRDKRRELEVATRRSYWDADGNSVRMKLEIELEEMVEKAREQQRERRGE